MLYHKEHILPQIKAHYKQSIAEVLVKHLDSDGLFDKEQVISAIAKLWFKDFLPKNPNLNTLEINEIWWVFDCILSDIDNSEHAFIFDIEPNINSYEYEQHAVAC